ncbi:hypothetical protein ACFPM3_22975 [Streptomyces coeruleoprunus]|uniref:Uncharacterized protein n=1 Tax=Streptomyces coeruleoprunus TaxID=285563 RepID=A0ABV9XI86_9ACTN
MGASQHYRGPDGTKHAASRDGRAVLAMNTLLHTARWWPGRAACMETSLGAVLAAALFGRRLDWCLPFLDGRS